VLPATHGTPAIHRNSGVICRTRRPGRRPSANHGDRPSCAPASPRRIVCEEGPTIMTHTPLSPEGGLSRRAVLRRAAPHPIPSGACPGSRGTAALSTAHWSGRQSRRDRRRVGAAPRSRSDHHRSCAAWHGSACPGSGRQRPPDTPRAAPRTAPPGRRPASGVRRHGCSGASRTRLPRQWAVGTPAHSRPSDLGRPRRSGLSGTPASVRPRRCARSPAWPGQSLRTSDRPSYRKRGWPATGTG
jgi:hypothetical protein